VARILEVPVPQLDRWLAGSHAIPCSAEAGLDSLLVAPFKSRHDPDFTFVDLFAGIGGLRHAFQGQGGRCVFTAEWNEFSRQTYNTNFGSDHDFIGDIRGQSHIVPAHDLLLAGFPCQPFSIAGVSKKNSLGRPHGFADPTQGTLFFEIKEILARRRPAAFVLENVKNLGSHDGGRTMKVILTTLRALGYKVSVDVIDGGHFTPQHRERTVITGVLEGDPITFDDLLLKDLPVTEQSLATVLHQPGEEAIPHDGARYFDHRRGQVQDKYILRPNLWQYLQDYAAKHKAAGNGFGFGLVKPDGRTRTLSARYYKDGSEILIDRGLGQLPRRLTPRECARLMGFPDDFVIPVSDSQAYKQFGNSVVVPMFAAIAQLVVPRIPEINAAVRAKRQRSVVQLDAVAS
jgi:DNA (cytosine-5)-methyltransferase 1